MDDKTKEIIRCTLQSYIGQTIDENLIDSHQKIAISRLTNMKEDRFEQLCLDLTNEIRRRNGLSFDKPNSLGEKLLLISEPKFKNLVLETLTVFYIKNPELKEENMPEFMNNLGNLINELKEQTDREIFLNNVEKLGFYEKMHSFLEYASKKGISSEIIDKMKRFMDQKIQNDAFDFLETLAYPMAFLDAFERSTVFEREIKSKPLALEKFNQIKQEVTSERLDLESNSKAIKRSVGDVLDLFIDNLEIPSRKVEYFETEISGVVKILTEIENEYKTKSEVSLSEATSQLGSILQEILNKSDSLNQENVANLKIQQISVENIGQAISRKESFQLILDIAKDIRKALSCI